MPDIDLFIPAAEKDYSKLPTIVAAARKLNIRNIHVACPSPAVVPPLPGVTVHADVDVLPFDRRELRFRPNWVFQQMLKLLQNVTESDWYLVIDADTYINRSFPLFSERGKPILYLGNDQYSEPYFTFNQRLLGLDPTTRFPHSFLSEATLYNKMYINLMLVFAGCETFGKFWEKVVDITDGGCYPAESEIYGNFLCANYPELYEIRRLRSSLGGKYGGHIWTQAEIDEEIAKKKSWAGECEIFSLHSWEGEITTS